MLDIYSFNKHKWTRFEEANEKFSAFCPRLTVASGLTVHICLKLNITCLDKKKIQSPYCNYDFVAGIFVSEI